MPRFAALFVLLALGACTDPAPSGSGDASGAPSESGATPAAPFDTVEPQSVYPNLTGADLLAALRADYTPERTLGYDRARDLLFTHEMQTAGHLRDPYTGFELALPSGEDPSNAAFERGVNTEHTWPQSKGARDEPLRSDMHHLYPVQDRVNSSRGNLPYGEVPDTQAEAWYTLDQAQSNPPTVHPERWSERGAGHWEPRDDDKGDVARALFYVYTVYGPSVRSSGGDPFFAGMRADLLRWTRQDPVTPSEAARSAWIAQQQGTPNPFVLDPTLADRAFGEGVPSTSSSPAPAPSSSASSLWISAIHYDNDGEDRGEGVGLSGLAGAGLRGWSLVLYNGASGEVYRTVPLSGSLDGRGQTFVDVEGMQNGAPDGVALVAPGGRVSEFLSYEGAFRASGGPASGRTSTDTGASESGRDAPGVLLLRERPNGAWRLGTR